MGLISDNDVLENSEGQGVGIRSEGRAHDVVVVFDSSQERRDLGNAADKAIFVRDGIQMVLLIRVGHHGACNQRCRQHAKPQQAGGSSRVHCRYPTTLSGLLAMLGTATLNRIALILVSRLCYRDPE
jgi:hypothetical protein